MVNLRQLFHRRGRRRLLHPVRWGSLRNLKPVSDVFGFDRGNPIDRYYIEQFLESHSEAIKGCVLEVGDAHYTRRFGGDSVECSEVLHATTDNPQATFIGELSSSDTIPPDRFDCIILTQTLQFIFDVQSAISNVHRALRPGGVVLATLPSITRISRYDMDRWGEFWRFTSQSAERLFAAVFGAENVTMQTFGNVLAATAFLQGTATEDLTVDELDHIDPDFEVLITIQARRAL